MDRQGQRLYAHHIEAYVECFNISTESAAPNSGQKAGSPIPAAVSV